MKAAKLSARAGLWLPDSHSARKVSISASSAASPVSRVIWGMVSAPFSCGALDESVEQGGPVGLAVVAGVVALADQDGQELGAGAEVGAGLAGGLHAAVEFGGAGA